MRDAQTTPACIYHAHCLDGFASAWVVHRALAGVVDCIPADYGEPLPAAIDGRTVYVVDFSYPRETILDLAARAKRVVILDHHKSAHDRLVDLPDNVLAIFDMDRSGAQIAWDYFTAPSRHGVLPIGMPRPSLIDHVGDRDLWRFALPGTDAVTAALELLPQAFEAWSEASVDRLRVDGAILLRKREADLAALLPQCVRRRTIAGHDVPVANLPPTLASDAGALMAQGEPFAAIYWDTTDCRKWSLRSASDGMDVAVVAGLFGGGGHAHAAGFKTHLPSTA